MRTHARFGCTGLLTTLALSMCLTTAHAQDSLKVGDRAPEFSGVADDGKTWRSSDHVGKQTLVVYFYPAAMTGGCTKQACGYRDLRTRLTKLGVAVVGVSGDRTQNLKYFKQVNRLNFPLLSDTSGTIARAFGVPLSNGGTIKRTVRGKEIELTRDRTAARWTFVVGRDGTIAMIETDVNPEHDAQAVAEAIEKTSVK